MIRHEHKGYFVGAAVVGQGQHEIKMYWSAPERSLSLDGQPVRAGAIPVAGPRIRGIHLGRQDGELAVRRVNVRRELTEPVASLLSSDSRSADHGVAL